MRDLPLVAQLDQRAEGLLEGHVGVHRVQLVELDALQAQAPQASLARFAQVLGAPVARPPTRTAARHAALGGDHEIVRVGVQRFGDQALGDLGPVAGRRVDEVDPQFDGPPEHAATFLGIVGFAPDAVAGETHRAEAQAAHGRPVGDREGPGRLVGERLRRQGHGPYLPPAQGIRPSVLRQRFGGQPPLARGPQQELSAQHKG